MYAKKAIFSLILPGVLAGGKIGRRELALTESLPCLDRQKSICYFYCEGKHIRIFARKK